MQNELFRVALMHWPSLNVLGCDLSKRKRHVCTGSEGEGERKEVNKRERARNSVAIRHPTWHQRCSSLCSVTILHHSSTWRLYSYSVAISIVLGLQSPKTVLANFSPSSFWLVSGFPPKPFPLPRFLMNYFPFQSNLVQNSTSLLCLSTSGFEITSET